MTEDGGAPPYLHGEAWDAKQTIELTSAAELPDEMAIPDGLAETNYVLLSEEDVANELKGIGTGFQTIPADIDEELMQDILGEIEEEEKYNEDEA